MGVIFLGGEHMPMGVIFFWGGGVGTGGHVPPHFEAWGETISNVPPTHFELMCVIGHYSPVDYSAYDISLDL